MKRTLKKSLSIILAALMMICSVPFTDLANIDLSDLGTLFASKAEAAEKYTDGYYTYTVDENGNATITDVDRSISGNITIPSILGGYHVTSIGYCAFEYCHSITSITIPDSVISIGDLAFSCCDRLTSITIPDSVTSIGGSAFSYCDRLTSITIPDSVTSIGDYAFFGCTSLTSVTICNGVKSIGNGAFDDCISLTSITIPDSVTSIGDYAFHDCESLTSITIPDSVTSIGEYAFRYCTNLTSITIPDGVTAIGRCAFAYCTNLTSITIPDSVTSIGGSAFCYCDRLISITIPDSVTSIGDGAFSDCDSLTSITISDSVTSIGGSAFSYCDRLTSITIPDSVTSIGDSAFEDCRSLTSITIPDSVTSIDNYAFSGCTSLTSVTIGNSVTSIGRSAFDDCISLTSITIPDSVTSIGIGAFSTCDSLTDVYYTGTETKWQAISIGYYNKDLTDATIHFNYVPEDDQPSVYYIVTWDASGGMWSGGDTRKVVTTKAGAVITAPTDPEKDGYEFVGWTPVIPETMPDSNLAFTALWIKNGTPPSGEEPEGPDDCETVVGILEDYETTVILNGNSNWISKVCIDGQWFNLHKDYAYQEKIKNYEDKQVVAVIYNGHVSTIDLLTELEMNPKIYGFSSLSTLEYYDGVFRDYDGSRADKWYTANGTVSNTISNVLIDESKIPSSESLKFKNVSVTIESSDKKIISLDNGFFDIESDITTIELGDIEAGKSVSFSERVLNLKTGWDFPDEEKEHSVTLCYTVTGTLNGKTISRVETETIRLINKDYSSDGSESSSSNKKQTVRQLFTEMKKEVNNCDALNGLQKYYVNSVITSHLLAIGMTDWKHTLDAAEKVYEISRYISGVDNVTYWTAGEYVIDAIWDDLYKGDDELKKAMKDLLDELRDCEEFNTFVRWYYDQQNTKKNSNKRVDTHCPVDVYVYDKNGKQLLSIVGNIITDADEEIHAFVCEDEKMFYLPTDTDYDIKIIATDNGTMDYIVTEYSSGNGLRETCYYDIPLTTNEYYIGEIVSATTPDTDVYNLYDSEGNEIACDESGAATVHIPGEWVIIKEATCTKSGEAVLMCTVCGEMLSVAELDTIGHTPGEWVETTAPTETTGGTETQFCTKCSEIIATRETEKLECFFIEGYYTYIVDCNNNAVITDVDTSISGDITIPTTLGGYTVVEIGAAAFDYCENITSVIIPKSIISIANSPFYWCMGLSRITVDPLNSAYCSDEHGVLYNKDKTKLIKYPAKSINNYYKIPKTVTDIGNSAFFACANLSDITIPDSVSVIGSWAFAECWSLKSFVIPDGITTIKNGMFNNCVSLSSITIPDSVTEINYASFFCCSSLTDVYYYGYAEEWNAITVEEYNEKLTDTTVHFDFDPNAHTHSYVSFTIIPATCVTNGTTIYTCILCGNNYTEAIPSTGHNSFEWIITENATCTENGKKVKKCVNCAEILETETIPATGHNQGEWVISIEPSCTEEGEKIANCTECGIVVANDVVSATGHTAGEIVVVTPATCTENGERVKKCVNCAEILETEVIPATGHTAGTWETTLEPTTETEGKKVKKCTVCAEILEESAIAKLPKEPVRDNTVVRTPSTSTINYGDAIILHVDESKIPAGGRVEWTASNGNFKWSANGATCEISPEKSGDTTFTATIYDADGNPVSTDEQTMTSKAGFFQKIIAFFKKLFGLTKTIPNVFEF